MLSSENHAKLVHHEHHFDLIAKKFPLSLYELDCTFDILSGTVLQHASWIQNHTAYVSQLSLRSSILHVYNVLSCSLEFLGRIASVCVDLCHYYFSLSGVECCRL